jgi:hypothetical protein
MQKFALFSGPQCLLKRQSYDIVLLLKDLRLQHFLRPVAFTIEVEVKAAALLES